MPATPAAAPALMIFTRFISSRGLGIARAEHAVQLVEQRLQVARQHAALVEALDQLVHRQQRVDLALAEPHAGQLVRLTWRGRVRRRRSKR